MKHLKRNERSKLDDDKKIYVPMNFNSMLSYLHNSMQQAELRSNFIGADKSISNMPWLEWDLHQFIKLFEFDRIPRES